MDLRPHKAPAVRIRRAGTRLLSGLLSCLLLTGCTTGPYQFGTTEHYQTSPELAAITESQIERGQPNRVIDGFGWVWGIPDKLLLFNRHVENHNIDEPTEAAIAQYLHANQLNTVKVRLNQYHPGDDWKRLVANKSVSPGWRYTLGTFSVLGETVLPGRLFGGDHYNPYTNTIHLYSSVPAIALHEGGHAKDFARRKWKGTYAAAYLIPGVPLYHEAIATADALDYLAATGDTSQLQQGYEILYPAYGSYVGDVFSGAIPFAYLGGIIGGHAIGRYQSYAVGSQQDSSAVRTASWEHTAENSAE